MMKVTFSTPAAEAIAAHPLAHRFPNLVAQLVDEFVSVERAAKILEAARVDMTLHTQVVAEVVASLARVPTKEIAP